MNGLAELQRVVRAMTGNVLPDAKAAQVLTRLRSEAPERGVEGQLADIERWGALPAWLKSEVVVGETFFFRHPQHFEVLAEVMKTRRRDRRGEVLCAGVSSGEEAYSAAITLDEAAVSADVRVTGVDINPAAIARARVGEYSLDAIARTPVSHRAAVERHVSLEVHHGERRYRVDDATRARVRFAEGNLFGFAYATYSAIFVRNILIYFTPEDRERILLDLFGRLHVGGVLFIGAGEVFPAAITGAGRVGPASVVRRPR